MSWNLGSQTPVLPVLSKGQILNCTIHLRGKTTLSSKQQKELTREYGILGFPTQNVSQVEGQTPKRGVPNTALLEEKPH